VAFIFRGQRYIAFFAESMMQAANSYTTHTIHPTHQQDDRVEYGNQSFYPGSDGASVMLGSRRGLAARLKEVNCRIMSIHCICHKLALACVATAKDVEYIGTVADLLRQLWKYREHSPTRMAGKCSKK